MEFYTYTVTPQDYSVSGKFRPTSTAASPRGPTSGLVVLTRHFLKLRFMTLSHLFRVFSAHNSIYNKMSHIVTKHGFNQDQ